MRPNDAIVNSSQWELGVVQSNLNQTSAQQTGNYGFVAVTGLVAAEKWCSICWADNALR